MTETNQHQTFCSVHVDKNATMIKMHKQSKCISPCCVECADFAQKQASQEYSFFFTNEQSGLDKCKILTNMPILKHRQLANKFKSLENQFNGRTINELSNNVKFYFRCTKKKIGIAFDKIQQQILQTISQFSKNELQNRYKSLLIKKELTYNPKELQAFINQVDSIEQNFNEQQRDFEKICRKYENFHLVFNESKMDDQFENIFNILEKISKDSADLQVNLKDNQQQDLITKQSQSLLESQSYQQQLNQLNSQYNDYFNQCRHTSYHQHNQLPQNYLRRDLGLVNQIPQHNPYNQQAFNKYPQKTNSYSDFHMSYSSQPHQFQQQPNQQSPSHYPPNHQISHNYPQYQQCLFPELNIQKELKQPQSILQKQIEQIQKNNNQPLLAWRNGEKRNSALNPILIEDTQQITIEDSFEENEEYTM